MKFRPGYSSKGNKMADKDTGQQTNEGTTDKSERLEARRKRIAERAEKMSASDRPTKLCTLSTVEVRQDHEGYQIIISGTGGRRSVIIAANDVLQVLKDLEIAIHVIRGQQ